MKRFSFRNSKENSHDKNITKSKTSHARKNITNFNIFAKIIAIFTLTFILSTPAFARPSSSQLDMFAENNILFYDPSVGSNCSSGGSANISGSEIKEKIWNGLISIGGFSEEQTAGIMGNMAHESGFSPARHETTFYNRRVNGENINIWTSNYSYGIGLIQWSFGRRTRVLEYIKSYDASLLSYIDDDWQKYGKLSGDAFFEAAPVEAVDGLLTAQIQFLRQEIETNGTYKGFLDKTTVADAAKFFLEKIEVPADIPGQTPGRIQNAETFYDIYHGTSNNDSSSSGGGTSSTSQNTIYVGDSRTVGLCTALGLSNCVAEVGRGYSWLVSTAEAKVKEILDASSGQTFTIVVNLGVNDLGNVQNYIQKYRELATGSWSGHKIVITAVAPVDDALASRNGYSVTNSAINSFNNTMSTISLDGGSYCPATASVEYSGTDGLHYSPEGYRAIYDATTKSCGVGNTSPTGVVCIDGSSAYTDDNYPIYIQTEEPWARLRYGCSGTIGGTGCGPSAMAMIITALTGQSVTPDMTAAEAARKGYAMCTGGSYYTVARIAENWGLQATPIGFDNIERLNEVLRSGSMIFTSGTGTSPFTSVGHMIGIRGVTADGKWKIFDSNDNGRETSAQEWDPMVIISQNTWGGYVISK